jgi:hypothetical protein
MGIEPARFEIADRGWRVLFRAASARPSPFAGRVLEASVDGDVVRDVIRPDAPLPFPARPRRSPFGRRSVHRRLPRSFVS